MRQYFGIDMGGTAVKWAVVGEDYAVRERGEIPTSFSSADELVTALRGLVEPHRDDVAGVGISAPGGFEEGDQDGTVHRGGALPYMDGCPLGRLMRESLGLPVTVNNDGKCAALGEYAAGALRGTRVGVAIAIGTGIGGGIVIGGTVLQGAHGFAGEFSFLNNNTLSPADPREIFGSTGSWMALSRRVCEEKGIEFDPKAVDGRRVFDWVAAGDEAARRALDAYALEFDNWLLNLQAIVDPDAFAIGGGISRRPELFEALDRQMGAALANFRGPMAQIPVPVIRPAALGNDANIYGAVHAVKKLVEAA